MVVFALVDIDLWRRRTGGKDLHDRWKSSGSAPTHHHHWKCHGGNDEAGL